MEGGTKLSMSQWFRTVIDNQKQYRPPKIQFMQCPVLNRVSRNKHEHFISLLLPKAQNPTELDAITKFSLLID